MDPGQIPDVQLLGAAMLAGMIYVLVPGPATLATLSLAATRGRRSALAFLLAHLAGDMFWTLMALLSLAGISRLGPGLFDLLGLICGFYLCWLGARALFARGAAELPVLRDPGRAGLIFGFSNPKAWPFALAMLTALLGEGARDIGLAAGAGLLAACLAGFLIADLIVVFWTGAAPVRRFWSRHAGLVTRATGAIFIAFGLKTLQDAATSLRGRM